jgi:hypothetical protein
MRNQQKNHGPSGHGFFAGCGLMCLLADPGLKAGAKKSDDNEKALHFIAPPFRAGLPNSEPNAQECDATNAT